MARLIYALLVGLVSAAIVHIAIVLLIPSYAPRDAWSRLAEVGELYSVLPVSGGEASGRALVRNGDPLFRAAACRFDLSDGPLRITADRRVPFWSLSIRDRAGQTTFSITDRASAEAKLDITVLSPLQMIEMRRDMPDGAEQSIFVESQLTEGIAVIRVFVPDTSWEPAGERFLSEMTCQPF